MLKLKNPEVSYIIYNRDNADLGLQHGFKDELKLGPNLWIRNRGQLIPTLRRTTLWAYKKDKDRREHRREGKVVAAVWGTELNQFLAALAILHKDDLKKMMNRIKATWGNECFEKKWMTIRFTSYETATLPKWMFRNFCSI